MNGTLAERLASTDPDIHQAAVAEAMADPGGPQHRNDRRAAAEAEEAEAGTAEKAGKKTGRKK